MPRIDLHVYLNYFFNYTYYLYCLLILLNFVCLLGNYFLVDCGFPNRRKFLAHFRSFHYHLQDFAGQGRDPKNEKELFNLHHSSLRNIIERIFGIFKS